jgi:hypothetical protein
MRTTTKVLSALAAGLVMAATGASASAADAIPVPTGPTEISTLQPAPDGHALCLDNTNGSSSPGNLQQVFHCHGTAPNGAPQLWQFIKEPDGFYTIENSDGLCLAPDPNTGVKAMSLVRQEKCGFSIGQQWTTRDSALGGRATELENVDSPAAPLCLSVRRGSAEDDHSGVSLLPCDTPTPLEFWLL